VKKVIVKCPACKETPHGEECALASVERVIDDVTYVYCCENQAKKKKRLS
jgi:hypothetical protein